MTEREELEMWKSMYMRLLRGTEDAINLLVQAEQDTEDLYIDAGLSRAQYASDTKDTKQWIPIAFTGDPEQLSYARAFRLSREEAEHIRQNPHGSEPERPPEQ